MHGKTFAALFFVSSWFVHKNLWRQVHGFIFLIFWLAGDGSGHMLQNRAALRDLYKVCQMGNTERLHAHIFLHSVHQST